MTCGDQCARIYSKQVLFVARKELPCDHQIVESLGVYNITFISRTNAIFESLVTQYFPQKQHFETTRGFNFRGSPGSRFRCLGSISRSRCVQRLNDVTYSVIFWTCRDAEVIQHRSAPFVVYRKATPCTSHSNIGSRFITSLVRALATIPTP